MALRIVDAGTVEVQHITCMVYGPPGIGKSSLGFTGSKPLVLDFDRGAHRAENREGKSVVQVTTWRDVEHITDDDLGDHETIVIDTAGSLLNFLSQDIMRRNPKMGVGGMLALKGFGELKAKFESWTSQLRLLGRDVVFIAHVDEQQKGDEVSERIIAQGASKQLLYSASDLIGRLRADVKGERYIEFDPTQTAYGKAPCGIKGRRIEKPELDSNALGDIIQESKDLMNAAAASAIRARKAIAEKRAEYDAYKTVEEFNEEVQRLKQGGDAAHKKMLVEHAGAVGFVFDRELGLFGETEEDAA